MTLRAARHGRRSGAPARLACAAVAWLALSACAPVASAQSTTTLRVGVLRFRDCSALEEAQVRPLLDADLRGTSADGTSDAIDVDVSCAGDAALVLSLPGRGGAPRVLDVGDVPARLRARLAALAISELLLVASLRAESPTAPAAPALDATVASPPNNATRSRPARNASRSSPSNRTVPAPESIAGPSNRLMTRLCPTSRPAVPGS